MLQAMHPPDLITVDPEILGGTPVFRGTRVPVKALFEYLEDNYSLEEFIECFPSALGQGALDLALNFHRATINAARKNVQRCLWVMGRASHRQRVGVEIGNDVGLAAAIGQVTAILERCRSRTRGRNGRGQKGVVFGQKCLCSVQRGLCGRGDTNR